MLIIMKKLLYVLLIFTIPTNVEIFFVLSYFIFLDIDLHISIKRVSIFDCNHYVSSQWSSALTQRTISESKLDRILAKG